MSDVKAKPDFIEPAKSSLPSMSEKPAACPHCGCREHTFGFGLAGGGYGRYYYCEGCATVIAKDAEDDT